MATIAFSGLDSTTFDLIYETRGRTDTLFAMSADTFDLFLNNRPGLNLYVLKKVIEYRGDNYCESELSQTPSSWMSLPVRHSPLTLEI